MCPISLFRHSNYSRCVPSSRVYPVFHLNLAIATERGTVLRKIDLGGGKDTPSSPSLLLPPTIFFLWHSVYARALPPIWSPDLSRKILPCPRAAVLLRYGLKLPHTVPEITAVKRNIRNSISNYKIWCRVVVYFTRATGVYITWSTDKWSLTRAGF